MKTKIPTPKEYCEAYFQRVYDKRSLDKVQAIEVSLAFHAGIEAMCKFMMEDFFAGEDDDRVLEERLVRFRNINKARALHINMSRFGENENID